MTACQWEGCRRAASVVFTVRTHSRGARIESRLCLEHHERASASISGESRFVDEDHDHPQEGSAACL